MEETHWRKSLINLHQSPAERRAKYRLCRCLGAPVACAMQRRDWRWNKIARVFGYTDFRHLEEALGDK